MTLIACGEWSTNTACFAPRLSASMPSCPLPANKSRTTDPAISNCMDENMPSFTRSVVGRTSSPSSVFRWMPLAVPVMTLILIPPSDRPWRWSVHIDADIGADVLRLILECLLLQAVPWMLP